MTVRAGPAPFAREWKPMTSRLFRLCCAAVALVLSQAPGAPAQDRPVVRIATIQDGPWQRDPSALDAFRLEVRRAVEDNYRVAFPAAWALDGGWTLGGIQRAVDRALDADDVDLVLVLGYAASDLAARRGTYGRPVLATLVVDADLQRLPRGPDGGSGVDNLAYLESPGRVTSDLKRLRELVPYRHVAVLVEGVVLEALSRTAPLALSAAEARMSRDLGAMVTFRRVSGTLAEAIDTLPEGVDAAYLTPLMRSGPEEFRASMDRLVERGVAAFSYLGPGEVRLGALATTTPDGMMLQLARQAGVSVLDILTGENPAVLPTRFGYGSQLTVNMKVARALGTLPGLVLRTEAELLFDEAPEGDRVLDLRTAIQGALAGNLDLAAADRSVSAGANRVGEARAKLFPRLDLRSSATAIDADRAEAARGSAPERALDLSATATQVLYAEDAWAGFRSEEQVQRSRVEARQAVRLDVMRAAATAYLNVLRARTLERIERDNLKLTRANLERARTREAIGVAGPDEVYRWESEIATRQRAVLEAESATLDARNELNRVLNRPLDEPFQVDTRELDDPMMLGVSGLFDELARQPAKFRDFRTFALEEANRFSPELRQFDGQIGARQRLADAARRAYWLPTFVATGGVTHLVSQGGEGTRDGAPADVDDTDWSVGVIASFPLFEGGGKRAVLGRTTEELVQLRVQQRATAERVGQRVLRALHRIRASYPGIGLSRAAGAAARRNPDLVTAAYERGVKSIVDLLDAQNLALRAEQRAANAVYDFLVDFAEFQRAVGHFDPFGAPDVRTRWQERVETYLSRRGS